MTYIACIKRSLEILDIPERFHAMVLLKADSVRGDLENDEQWQKDMEETFESPRARQLAILFLKSLQDACSETELLGVQIRGWLENR